MPVRIAATSPALAYSAATKSDDTTDDLAALQAGVTGAIAAKLPLRVKGGTTKISARLDLTAGTPGLVGDGRGVTILKSHEAGDTNRVVRVEAASNQMLRGFTLIGTAAARDSASIGLEVDASSDVLIDDVEVGSGVAAGILIHKSDRVRVRSCYVHDTFADGIHFTDGTYNGTTYSDCIIEGNHCENTGDDGIAGVAYGDGGGSFPQATTVRRVTITGNVVVNSSSGGIANHGGADVTITGNIIDVCKAHGINLDSEGTYDQGSVARTTITGNVIKDAGTTSVSGSWHAISLNALASNTTTKIADNIIDNPDSRAINGLFERASITGNIITMGSPHAEAIVLGSTTADTQPPHRTKIDGNEIYDCYVGAVVVIAPSADHAKAVSICGNIIDNINTSAGATTDAIYCENVDDLVIDDNIVTNPGLDLRYGMRLVNCNHVTIGEGNIWPSDDITDWYSFTNCTGVLMPTITHPTAAPSDTTTFRAGQRWLRVSTGKLYVFDGTAWQILN